MKVKIQLALIKTLFWSLMAPGVILGVISFWIVSAAEQVDGVYTKVGGVPIKIKK